MISKFSKLGTAILALLVTSISANAADIPVKGYYKGPPRSVVSYYNWTGAYIGINGGYGWGNSDWDSPLITLKPKGGMVGATLGYNWQNGAIGRPTAFVMTSLPTTQVKARIYNDMNFGSR